MVVLFRNVYVFLLVVCLVSVLFLIVPFVSAVETQFGMNGTYFTSLSKSANQMWGINCTTFGWSSDMQVINGHAVVSWTSAGSFAKMIIFDSNLDVVAVSQAVAVPNSIDYSEFLFSGSVVLDRDQPFYVFGVVVNGSCYMAMSNSDLESYVVSRFVDDTNSFLVPESPVGNFGSFDATNRNMVYLSLDQYISPSPSPTPTVASGYPLVDPFVPVPSYYMVLLVLFAVVAVLAGLYVTFEREQENKGVVLLFVLVGLVLFVILIVGYFVGF